ncbi:hypothetical protein [Moritella sp.]|uniref:hypothetical protein n=1 Tax=Moritella sp. TaxID=78556 RepID=UPI001D77A999|nr:hypothetical protein [Moritella sp.]MCJ8349189.1 hypothetical protein [Moritella sp.]NQZ39477.1 hypothetical protein [Moritella sp.]
MSSINISSSKFPQNEKVFLDTNVLYWLTFASARSLPSTLKPSAYQLEEYPALFQAVIEKNNQLIYSHYSIPELVNIIVNVESSLSGCGKRHEKKKWLRKGGRQIIVSEMKTIIETLESWGATPLGPIPPLDATQYMDRYANVYLDGYDLFIENELSTNNIKYILTDDIDFLSVNSLDVITANRNA